MGRPGPQQINEILRWLGSEAGPQDNFYELCRAVAIRKNREHASKFARVPFSERIVLVPQCLRRIGKCKARETPRGYDCASCMACPAGEILQECRKLGYKGVYMLKGGRAVAAIITESRPSAVVGIACDYEGALGIMECERAGVAVQFVPLSRDGCFETDVDVAEVLSVLRFSEPPSGSGP